MSFLKLQYRQRAFDDEFVPSLGHARLDDQFAVVRLARLTSQLGQSTDDGDPATPVLIETFSALLSFANNLNTNLDVEIPALSTTQQKFGQEMRQRVGRMSKAAEELDHRSDYPSYAVFKTEVVALAQKCVHELTSRGENIPDGLDSYWLEQAKSLKPMPERKIPGFLAKARGSEPA